MGHPPPKKRISKSLVDDLEVTGSDYIVWDADLSNFGVRVSPAGAKAYVFRYRMGGRNTPEQRQTIGKCGSLTADSARKIAHEKSALVRQGIDPKAQKASSLAAAKQKAERDKKLAFDIYCEKYLHERVKVEIPASYPSLRSCLRLHAIDFWKSKPLPQISKADVTALIDNIPIYKQSVRSQAHIALSKLFKWAVGRGDLEASPMIGMNPPKPPKHRDRVLSDDELSIVLGSLNKGTSIFDRFFRLLILTGQRRVEVAGLDWSELSRQEATWTLPEHRTKNDMAHIIPLSTSAIRIFDEIARVATSPEPEWPKEGLVFTTTGKTPISGFSRAKQHLDAAMLKIAKADAVDAGDDPEAVKIADWRIHDLRRTMATGFQKLGVRFEVTEATLNHSSGRSRSGVAATYQKHDWKDEKREALQKWADHCERLLSEHRKQP